MRASSHPMIPKHSIRLLLLWSPSVTLQNRLCPTRQKVCSVCSATWDPNKLRPIPLCSALCLFFSCLDCRTRCADMTGGSLQVGAAAGPHIHTSLRSSSPPGLQSFSPLKLHLPAGFNYALNSLRFQTKSLAEIILAARHQTATPSRPPNTSPPPTLFPNGTSSLTFFCVWALSEVDLCSRLPARELQERTPQTRPRCSSAACQ